MFEKLKRIFNPPRFVIKIDNGVARTSKGEVPHGFLVDCSEIDLPENEGEYTIYGMHDGYVSYLEFSKNIPEEFHQRFRNAWTVHKKESRVR